MATPTYFKRANGKTSIDFKRKSDMVTYFGAGFTFKNDCVFHHEKKIGIFVHNPGMDWHVVLEEIVELPAPSILPTF
jgi:hypothetical protein